MVEIALKTMPKRQKALQDLELSPFKKTFGEFNIIKTIDMARLLQPDEYPYKQQHRLYRKSTAAAISAQDEIAKIFRSVPDSYKLEFIASRAYEDFDKEVRDIGSKQREKRAKEFNSTDFDRYSQMMLYGIQGLVATMPKEFATSLRKQLEPFLSTMQAISSYENARNAKSKIPSFRVPAELWIDDTPKI